MLKVYWKILKQLQGMQLLFFLCLLYLSKMLLFETLLHVLTLLFLEFSTLVESSYLFPSDGLPCASCQHSRIHTSASFFKLIQKMSIHLHQLQGQSGTDVDWPSEPSIPRSELLSTTANNNVTVQYQVQTQLVPFANIHPAYIHHDVKY